jgi:glycosyltransferase involved in cell wall biosynthesis
MQPPRISVLIPTYTRATLLESCLESILGQVLRPTQILVIDDGSTDSTPELLEGLRPAVESIRVPQGGKSTALNAGLRLATGDYLWFFDDDDIAVPDALERFVAPLERDPSLGFSYSHYWYTPCLDDGRLDEPKGFSTIPDVQTRGFLAPLLEFNFLSGAALFARTRCYAVVGGFDPALVRSQEYDMAIRIARRFQGEQVRGGPTFHLRLHSGPRGSESDRFRADAKKRKWLEYDQIIFRRLRQELSLEEYLGPGLAIDSHRRSALLQRAVAMASKSLFAEALEDLAEIAHGPDQSDLRPYEIPLVRKGLASRPFYGGGVRSSPETLAALRRLSRQSRAVADLCSHLRAAILNEFRGPRSGQRRWKVADARTEVGRMSRLAMELARLSRVVP